MLFAIMIRGPMIRGASRLHASGRSYRRQSDKSRKAGGYFVAALAVSVPVAAGLSVPDLATVEPVAVT